MSCTSFGGDSSACASLCAGGKLRALCAGEGEEEARRWKVSAEGRRSCPRSSYLFTAAEIVGARFSAHDPRNGRGLTAPRSPPRSSRWLNCRTICPTKGHKEITALRAAPDRTRPEATRAVRSTALECLRAHGLRGDRHDAGGVRASGTSIRAQEPRRQAEIFCHVDEAMTRSN